MNAIKTIQSGQTLQARSACDYDTIFTAEVIERKGSFVTVNAMNNTKRVKVQKDQDGNEFIYALGKYSMSPIFRAA